MYNYIYIYIAYNQEFEMVAVNCSSVKYSNVHDICMDKLWMDVRMNEGCPSKPAG